MCGVAGLVGGNFSPEGFESTLRCMGDTLTHRGPDDSGIWFDCRSGVGLVHRRLSILDLSAAGHQPMISASGRFVIAFNGEIYNHLEIRRLVESSYYKVEWRGRSDTETLLAGFDALGIEDTLRRSVGMFAIAVWDRETHTLSLAIDRMGEKPLYYGYTRKALVFGSELQALLEAPDFPRRINREAVALLLRHNYVPAPYTIYEGVAKLSPGTILEFSKCAITKRNCPRTSSYWSAKEAALAGVAQPLNFSSDSEAADRLEAELQVSVTGQMVADVPIGAFLSGGIDSSLVVAIMRKQANRPVKTFTIGFHEDGYDEAVFAKKVASYLGTEHTELYVSPQEALDVIPKLPEIYSEPFSDSTQIPNFLVSRLARQQVTVSLSGDGGDELFGGYDRYSLTMRLWGKMERFPLTLRVAAARTVQSIPAVAWNTLYAPFRSFFPREYRWTAPGDKLHKGAALLHFETGLKLYHHIMSHCSPAALVLGLDEPSIEFTQSTPHLPSLAEQMMLLDTLTYLPHDIFVKVDRAAMATSLETRAPLVDHRLYEFAWRLPLHYKIRGGVGKWLLRQVLYRHVPQELIDRPKKGFSVPIGSWLRGPLRDWAEGLLDETRLRAEGCFNPVPIRQVWLEHLSGIRNWEHQLWNVLMFQAWYEANISGKHRTKNDQTRCFSSGQRV